MLLHCFILKMTTKPKMLAKMPIKAKSEAITQIMFFGRVDFTKIKNDSLFTYSFKMLKIFSLVFRLIFVCKIIFSILFLFEM